MSTVEEAASLFGAPDSANDPFASTLAENTESSESDTNIHAGNELFSGQNYDSTSDIFDTTASNGTGSYNPVVHTNETTNHVNANTWNTTSYDYPSGSGLTNGSSFHGTQAYGSVTDTKHNEYPSYEPAQSTYAANGSHYSSTQYANGYNASQYSYNASSSIYSPPAQNQVPTAYDPYVPSQTASVSNSQTVYDPYKPSQAYVPQQAQPAVNTSYAPSPPSVEPKPKSSFTAEVPPPLPSASAYRPKASNAYDPPLPPPKPRRTSGWQVPTSPGVTASYPLPNTVVQPILSPPPPPRSVSRQHTQPTVPHPYAPIPEPERHNTLPPHISTQSANGYAPETQWSQASSHSLGQSGYAPPAQSAPSQYSPSTTPAVAVVPATGWANLDHTVSQVMDDSPYQPGPIEPTLEDISQAVDNEIPGDEFSRAYGESLEANQSEPTQIIPSNVDTKPPSPHAQTYHPVGNGHSSNPSSRQQSPVRAKSPGSTSIRSWGSGKRQSVIASPPPPQAHDYSHPPAARSMYDPPVIPPSQRTASPSVMSVRSIASVNAYDSYGSSNGLDSLANRDRSMSNASLLSVSSSVHDPYAPSLHSQSRQQSVDDTIHGTAFHPGSSDHSFASASYGSQVLSTGPRPTHTPYAPSPSLSGTNDPLGRTSARIPVFSFGFGGRIVTCFHGSSSLNTGFDVALSSRPSTDVHFRVLNKVIPESALSPSAVQFPGPLFSDPGTPSTSIIGSGAAAQTKAKKARVIKYLEERAEEISQSIGYLQQGNTESQNAQAKHVLVKLLKVMVEHDGRLSGSPEIDSAVRAALVPYIANADISTDGLKTAASIGFPRVGDSHPGDLASPPYPGLPSISQDTTGDPPIAVNTLRATNLDRIQELLIRGERQAAYQYAADEKLWAHAMVIASSIGKEAWKNIVSEFVRTELTSAPTIAGLPKPSALDGREPLKVAYSLFAGQGAAAVQELLPPKPLVNSAPPPAQTLQSLQVLSPPAFLAGPGFTPMTPNFPQSVQAAPIPPSILSKWTETAAMMISSPMTNETSSALTSLGDQLAANGWVEAAHCCYLLSPQTSPFGGIGVPACRVHLLGASPGTTPSFWKDPDTIVLSEIVEFALSLVPSVKGQEPFHGLPHLQAYRLIRAMALAELGYDQQSNRYCEAITQSISRSSPYIHTTLVEQLKGLSDRLIAAPHVDKSGSWIGSKMAKPSLDKLGNWLEGRFTSFIAGDTDSPLAEDSRGNERTFGAFTHYSTISSTTTSAMGSPHLSTTDLTEIPPTPPYRTGSAMALRSSAGQQVPINRASSAMDYIRRKASPVPRTSSANALTTSIPNTPSFPPHSYGTNGVTPKTNGPSGNRLAEITPQELSPTTPSQTNGGWWGATESSVPTPTAASFVTTNVPVVESTDGFISLMDDPALSLAPSPAPSSFNRTFSSSTDVDFDDDDLGLSTNKSRKPAPSIEKVDSQQSSSSSSSTVEERKGEPAKTEDKSEPKQTSSGGWLSRIWGGAAAKSDKPAPIKANLGEQTSFYYDKELKRWVNKGAGPEPTKATPPPPPPRAQTASPGTAGARLPGLSPAPPIARPSTTVDLSEPPRKPPMRIRSNLVPPETASAPTTPASSTMSPMNGPPTPGLNGPPSARLKAQAKRSVRSRYVDVFQQPGAA